MDAILLQTNFTLDVPLYAFGFPKRAMPSLVQFVRSALFFAAQKRNVFYGGIDYVFNYGILWGMQRH